jgi:hypothetical protein
MIPLFSIIFIPRGTADVQVITVKTAAPGNLVFAPFFHIASHV